AQGRFARHRGERSFGIVRAHDRQPRRSHHATRAVPGAGREVVAAMPSRRGRDRDAGGGNDWNGRRPVGEPAGSSLVLFYCISIWTGVGGWVRAEGERRDILPMGQAVCQKTSRRACEHRNKGLKKRYRGRRRNLEVPPVFNSSTLRL